MTHNKNTLVTAVPRVLTTDSLNTSMVKCECLQCNVTGLSNTCTENLKETLLTDQTIQLMDELHEVFSTSLTNDQRTQHSSSNKPNNKQANEHVHSGCLKETLRLRDKSLILPDLVSNIKETSDVTPLNSPDSCSSDALSCHMRTSQECLPSVREKETLKPVHEQQTNRTNEGDTSLQNNTAGETSVSSQSASNCLRVERLRLSLVEDAMKIYKKYLANDAQYSVGVCEATVDNVLKNISVTQKEINSISFVPAQKIVFSVLEKE